MTSKFYDGIVFLARGHRDWVTCTKGGFDYAVMMINDARRTAQSPLLRPSVHSNGTDWSLDFDDEGAKRFGMELHRIIAGVIDRCDVADGEPEFFPLLIGIGELEMIADHALEGAFQALWSEPARSDRNGAVAGAESAHI